MKTPRIAFLCLVSLFLLSTTTNAAINTKDTRLLSQPAISAKHVAFIYAEDLWISNLDGSQIRRLTVDEGVESLPVFSPDGKQIAFSAEYDGNTDIYLIPVEGGIPVRLTWHPGADLTRGFSADGLSVQFISRRSVFTNRYFQLYTVSTTGGLPQKIDIPNVFYASFSPDSKSMAYTPLYDAFRQWKNYRGGTISTIWKLNLSDYSVFEMPKPSEGCNDIYPMWVGNKIFFLSDRMGEFNLFSFDNSTEEIIQLTRYKDFPILSASTDGDNIIFEQGGYLYKYNIASSSTKKLTIGIAADLLELRSRYVSGSNYIRSAHISPTGVRAVFDFRGEIITLPAEKGDARNLTQTNNVHEKYPAWSPDGSSLAYFSDASGEYELLIKAQDGKGETKSFKLTGTGFYSDIQWSPDNKKICFVDNGRNLYLINIDSGKIKHIDADELYRPGSFRNLFGDWAHDSEWFVYTRLTETNYQRVYIYSIEQGKSFAVSDGLSDVTEPVFDANGKYLYFFASTDAGPVVNWFDQSNADMRMTKSLYLVTLQKETTSPFT
ncbi:MAG: peptidase S41, partial [Bacteroidetes bacterium]|nr:peptidase S41 [Bacteroidota bacterium]